MSQMAEAASSKEQSFNQGMGTAAGKNRGIPIFQSISYLLLPTFTFFPSLLV